MVSFFLLYFLLKKSVSPTLTTIAAYNPTVRHRFHSLTTSSRYHRVVPCPLFCMLCFMNCSCLLEDGNPFPGGGGLLAESASFDLVTGSEVHVKALASMRLPLLALTVRELPLYIIFSIFLFPYLFLQQFLPTITCFAHFFSISIFCVTF